MRSAVRGAVLRRVMATLVDMPSIRCTEEEAYASQLALIVESGLELADAAPATHNLPYFALPRPFGSLHLLTNFEYW